MSDEETPATRAVAAHGAPFGAGDARSSSAGSRNSTFSSMPGSVDTSIGVTYCVRIERLTMPDVPSPHSPVLLDEVLPSADTISRAIKTLAEI